MFYTGRASLTDIATWDFVSQTKNIQTCASLGFQNTMDALQLKCNVSIRSQQKWLSTLWFKMCFEIVYKHNEDTSLKRLLSNHHCRACSSSFRGFYYFFWGWILYLNESPVVIHWSARKLLFIDKCLLCHNTQISHSRRLETLLVRFDVNDVKCFGSLVSQIVSRYVRLKCVFL